MQELKKHFLSELTAAKTAEALEAVRIKYLGKKGIITNFTKTKDLKALSSEAKQVFYREYNELKTFAADQLKKAAPLLGALATAGAKKRDVIDLTAPGTGCRLGALHPITLTQIELETIFEGMGFSVYYGPEVESEYFCFEALNIPFDHPARDMQDTFWLKNNLILRTHTSANQVRTILKAGAPLRAIFPGRCFRYEAIDPSHENTFYQCEGLVIDKNISVANLIAVMKTILSEVFRREVKVRLRPGFFPSSNPDLNLT